MKILSCPFCGSDEVDVARTNVNACWIECVVCSAQTRSRKTRIGAIRAWNTRASRPVEARVLEDDDAQRGAKGATKR